jgi:hypothetical protein
MFTKKVSIFGNFLVNIMILSPLINPQSQLVFLSLGLQKFDLKNYFKFDTWGNSTKLDL